MESNWAAEHLQTIRTLMERSAVYRRALAPVMFYAGFLGILAAAAGTVGHLDSVREFGGLWLATAAIAVGGAFLIVRRQAFKAAEPFWSLPTRRVTQAALPPLASGMCLGMVLVWVGLANAVVLTFTWVLFYGCALHAAGFFMPRGVKWFGWIYIGLACGGLILVTIFQHQIECSAHYLMGFFFGILHLLYGAYLYLTEKGKNAA